MNAIASGELDVTVSPSTNSVVTMDGSVSFSCSPTGGCPPYTYSWSFDNASGTPPTDKKDPGDVAFGSSAGGKKNKVKVTVTDSKQASKSAETFVYVPNFEVLELTFTTDHNLLKDNNSDWEDSGTKYTEPEWKSGTNNPISQTKNTNVGVKMKIKVTPTDTPSKSYNVVGSGPTGMNFDTSLSLAGGDNADKTATSTDKLEDKIHAINGSIEWKFKLSGGESTPVNTGSHKVYVTYGTPGGSSITEKRVAYVVDKASGQADPHDALAAVHGGSYVLGSATPTPIWKIAGGTPGECIHLAQFDDAAIQMLGCPAGSIRYLYVKLGESSKESASSSDWEIRASDGAKLIFEDGSTPPGLNNWEAALKYTSGGTTKYYAGGAGIYNSVQDCMDAITTKTYWYKLPSTFDLAETW
jgi:hypothetical protein